MARIEYMANRLHNWAMYKARERTGGVGFATVSVMMMERVDQSRNSNISGTIEAGDALMVDAAVEALKMPWPTLHKTVLAYYLEGNSDADRAHRAGCPPSTLHARLGQADRVLLDWLNARAKPVAPAPASLIESALHGGRKIVFTP